jgi:hypothetical protein
MEEDKIKPVPKPTESHSSIVETFAEDMAYAIGGDSGSSVKNIIKKVEEHEAERKNFSPQSRKNKNFMLSGLLLLVAALSTFSFLFIKNNANTVIIPKQFTPMIFTDQNISFDITGLKKDDIVKLVSDEIGKVAGKTGELEGIYLTQNKQNIGLREFLALTESHFAPTDNTLFVSNNFLLGVVKNQTEADTTSGTGFFILMKMRSTSDIFDSMKAWEPQMLNDLGGFFGVNIEGDNNYLLTKDFEDGIVENKNARILYDQNGNIVLMYVYANDNSVIITDSAGALHEVLLRLTSLPGGQ